jgi:putative RNA 2'-phosphotransferase
MNNELVQISKFLSFALRHKPEAIGITLDAEGWAAIDELLAAAARHGQSITRQQLEEVVATNDKKRFSLSSNGQLIRASQGHSVGVDLGLTPLEPPEFLYHGTVERILGSIRQEGLLRGRRQYVHLSADRETASRVGQRRGRPVVLEVAAANMHRDGRRFYQSENGVWLTETVPRVYLQFPKDLRTLYRPVGLEELELIRASGMTRFPPRLPEQPIFYPVLTKEYAQQIAEQWNTKDSGRSAGAGFVTAFDLSAEYLERFEKHTVGSSLHRELWVPADELDVFNSHIFGRIRVTDAFYGEDFQGLRHNLDALNAATANEP